MKKGQDQDYNRFRVLLEKHFLENAEKKITDERVNRFNTDLAAMQICKEMIFRYLYQYFYGIFTSVEKEINSKRFLPTRDYSLEIYAKVFSDLFTEIKPIIKPEVPLLKADLIMFLLGIETPYTTDKSMTNIMNSIPYKIQLYAESDETVLITGETGTGKELHAMVVHFLSSRSKEKFVAINCAGIPETLLESQLFGIIRGAATDVLASDGILNSVKKGTLFLDEIGDMPMALQAKILRVLESRKFSKVGDHKNIYQFNGRVVAATNRDLKAAMQKTPQTFRPDLYYRLNVLPINLPPLRSIDVYNKTIAIMNQRRRIINSKKESPDFLHAAVCGDVKGQTYPGDIIMNDFSIEAMQLLLDYDFPGNHRELHNIIKRAMTFAKCGEIETYMLGMETEEDNLKKRGIEKTDMNPIMLKDIIERADGLRAAAIRRHIESVYRSGQDLKSVLASEGVTSVSAYQTFRNRVETIIGRNELGRIKRQFKPSKQVS